MGRLATICGQNLKKGHPVNVEGYLKTRSWEDADGRKSYRAEIVIDDVIFFRPKRE